MNAKTLEECRQDSIRILEKKQAIDVLNQELSILGEVLLIIFFIHRLHLNTFLLRNREFREFHSYCTDFPGNSHKFNIRQILLERTIILKVCQIL